MKRLLEGLRRVFAAPANTPELTDAEAADLALRVFPKCC